MENTEKKTVKVELTLEEKLAVIQTKLVAPKGQYNSFGKYNYRSCEDILEAVKKHLKDLGLTLRLTDEPVEIGDRYYIKATAILTDAKTGEHIENTAYARESETKSGMDASQITGATSSYARKYALNGLFCIDDTKDADVPIEAPKKEAVKETVYATGEQILKITNLADEERLAKILEFYKVKSIAKLTDAQAKQVIRKLSK